MSKNIFDPLGDALSDSIKSLSTTISKSSNKEDVTLSPYISSILGGTLITYFSAPIGLTLFAVGCVGAVADVFLSDCDEDLIEEKVVEDVEGVIEEPYIKEDIFKYIGCKNALKEYPQFLYRSGGGFVYNRPDGITLQDVLMHTEDIKLALNIVDLEVLLIDNNRKLLIREFVDKLGNFVPYVNNKRDTKNALRCFIGVRMLKGELIPLELNFTDYYHLMVSSTTGMGKSSVIRVILLDLMLNYSPEELQLYLVDMKRTELVSFNGCKHMAMDCITEHVGVVSVLNDLWLELSNRKDIVSKAGFQNMYQYNEENQENKMNYILLVIDEMLEVVNNGEKDDIKEAKKLLGLLLSQGRAFGMYFILSTQQPSRKLIEGSIQSNIGQKFSLRVASKTDVEVVFDGVYAPLNTIKTKGRGFYLKGGDPVEVQCYYVGDPKLKNEQKVLKKMLKEINK